MEATIFGHLLFLKEREKENKTERVSQSILPNVIRRLFRSRSQILEFQQTHIHERAIKLFLLDTGTH